LRHENMEGRRWPVISIALIAINVVAFLGTHWANRRAEIPAALRFARTSSCLLPRTRN
jgi:hypothetical protein